MSIKALVVDDMVFFRKMFSDALKEVSDFEVVGSAFSGKSALEKLDTTKVDLVLLDVYMPEMDGFETMEKIKELHPEIMVVMMSALASREADIVVKALGSGALEFIRKPDDKSFEKNVAQLRHEVKELAGVVKARILRSTGGTVIPAIAAKVAANGLTSRTAVPPRKRSHVRKPQRFEALVIGVSTGGPVALDRLIPKLPADFPLPVLVVQHMPPLFTASLAKTLDRKSNLTVVEARHGEAVNPGKVYIAPGGHHMVINRHMGVITVVINDDPPENNCRPAVDPLFRSVAEVYGKSGVVAAILTGMGSDGAKGVRALKKDCNCYCITQSESSCVIYGMPRAVDEASLNDISVDIDDMAVYISNLSLRS